jgi:pimeloyl-ACP methyl ester carboxylesterase
VAENRRAVERTVDGVGGRLTLPDTATRPGAGPWVFFVPPPGMGEGERERRFGPLFRRLVGSGLAVYRFTPAAGDEAELLAQLAAARGQTRLAPERWVAIGHAAGADALVAAYPRWVTPPVREPGALVLLSTAARGEELNRVTCPMLVMHGEFDPRFGHARGYERVIHLVMRHRSRFTDASTFRRFPGLDERLGEELIDRDVVDALTEWLGRALREGHRAQEPVVSGACRRLVA